MARKSILEVTKEAQRLLGASPVMRLLREEPEPPARRGSPVKYNWDRIDAEMRRRLSGKGPREKREDFIVEIRKWHQREFPGEAPSLNTLRPRYAMLRKQLVSN
jgi:hypothetical protein